MISLAETVWNQFDVGRAPRGAGSKWNLSAENLKSIIKPTKSPFEKNDHVVAVPNNVSDNILFLKIVLLI